MAGPRKITQRWDPFEPAVLPARQQLEAMAAGEKFKAEGFRVFMNNLYQVNVYAGIPVSPTSKVYWLSIKLRSRNVVTNWRDLQRIKNEIIGPEHEAVQLFPAESRLVDTSNQYHLWVLANEQQFPFGYVRREVAHGSHNGSKQEPFTDPPADVQDASDLAKPYNGVRFYGG